MAVDLLWLDGEWLLDVPLLERKRVLEVDRAGRATRPARLYVRQPLGSWIGSWRAQGFRGMTFKSANSPLPTGRNLGSNWIATDMPRR